MVMLLLDAVVDVAQAEFEVMVQATTAAAVSDVVVKVAAFVPAAVPLTVHEYEGALPPLVGEAVKVTDAPAQVGLEPVVRAMLTAGADGVDTVTVIELEVAGLPITPLKLDVITQVTTSPLTHVDEL
jgi:ribosomal protein L25 (general stress protein Ctc)